MSARLKHLAIALTLLASVSAQAGAPLGRLFFTPAERSAMDRHEVPAAQIPPPQVNGIVRRNNGRATVWVNGEQRRDIPASDQRAQVIDPRGVPVWRKVGEPIDDDDTPPVMRIERHRR
ncbi:MAG TPA: hypothetical protein PLI17_15135 [Denitromonas sp.]|uniref:hypothetical protein n=1 Tax=Denitromonas sp. TaxID=2734609 RepID=UPI001D264A22|nr:hypothetical protein [Rhodocyclaceae bacterium]HPR07962.1 hypothetical protein [Denitromonas sp.]HQU88161.1 hypothetical protein [Denitromonas sp.]